MRCLLIAAPAAQQKLSRVVKRPELDQIGADPHAALALGAAVSAARAGKVVRPGHGVTHGFFPNNA